MKLSKHSLRGVRLGYKSVDGISKKRSESPTTKERRRLAKQAWIVFSRYVRTKDVDFQDRSQCYTCKRRIPWKELDAGHFKHTSKKKGQIRTKVIDYDERNIHAQCTFCNRMAHGNLTKYAIALEEQYGHGIIQELDRIYHQQEEMTTEQLKEIINRYENVRQQPSLN